ncbi:MAG: antirestriction protein ArdA [Bacteroidaceae bacterium]|nr:antirestriction protein ArdA [Bacteroidaceae bacterium]
MSGEHDIDAARDAHVGEYDSEEDFAYEILEECDYYGMPENMRHYFNVSRFAEDLFDFDYYFENGHVFNRC